MSDTAAAATEAVITREAFDGVAFDLDGVLTPTALVHETAWKQVFDDYLERQAKLDGRPFLPFSSQDYHEYVDGRPREDGVRNFLAARGLTLPEGNPDDSPDRDTVHGLGRRKTALFVDLLERDGVQAYPNAVPLIQRLRAAGFKTAVISASKNCAAVLRAAGIAELFDVTIDGLDRERLGLRGKPAPDTFLEATRRLGAEPSRIMVVEDALAGVEAGRAGGFGLVVGVSRDGDPDSLRVHGADVVVPDLSKIQVRESSPAYLSHLSARQQIPPLDSPAQRGEAGPWILSYEGFEPALEGRREALFTLGNGYFATRGAAAEALADGIHYPGTYLAGGYNRLTSEIAGRTVEHEDLVNWPNWLPLSMRVDEEGSEWFSPGGTAKLLQHRQDLDLRRGLYRRTARFRDALGRVIRFEECRLVHLRERHLAALRVRVTAENWSGRIVVRSALDGRVTNAGVHRYQPFNGHHIETLDATELTSDTVLLEAQASESRIRVVEAARTRLYRDGQLFEPPRQSIREPGLIGQEMVFRLDQGKSVDVEKVVSLYTSRDRAIADARLEALTALSRAGQFAELARSHTLAWVQLWRRVGLGLVGVRNEADHHTQRIARFHIFHLLQTVSPHTIDLDAGVPARGWTGEGYRGHVFWDELFIFPFLNHRLPKLTRAVLLYRWRRLAEARWAAREAGYRGAMFPWQSGSNGREETDVMFLNPRSGAWIRDNTHLQRHVNAAIAYNVWQYYRATDDREFLYGYGAELLLEIARFWGSIAQWNADRQRYEIRGVMGPDEFHDAYPGAETPGLNNNAYTNVMAAWCIGHALRLFDLLPDERCRELCETLRLNRAELERWAAISRKMFVPFHEDGIISQFEGYEQLEEFDWKTYRRRYGNIMRLDLILEAEGDTPNRYKLSKQADVLMLFYLFSAEALIEQLNRLGYAFDGSMIPRNVNYYLERTSHGSTLSGIVHAWVLSRSCRRRTWALFKQALHSDINDIQGGTTAEGIHLGAMAGTLDLIQRCYTGLELRGDELWFNPMLPEALSRLKFQLRHRGHTLQVEITDEALSVVSQPADTTPITIRCKDASRRVGPGETARFSLSPSASRCEGDCTTD
ncbi:MAG: beta-phosphoglucomutase family hydrolase [Nitrococcus mobilis]|nr:beta-phosphoglucomutase family hydrolase [Nitrococcus mobilis]